MLLESHCKAHPFDCTDSTDCPPAKRLRQPTIVQTLADKKATDMVVAEFFYGCGLAIHLVRQGRKACIVSVPLTSANTVQRLVQVTSLQDHV